MTTMLEEYEIPGAALTRLYPPEGGEKNTWLRTPDRSGGKGSTLHDSLIEALSHGCRTLPDLVKLIESSEITLDAMARANHDAVEGVIMRISIEDLLRSAVASTMRHCQGAELSAQDFDKVRANEEALEELQGMIGNVYPLWTLLQTLRRCAQIVHDIVKVK